MPLTLSPNDTLFFDQLALAAQQLLATKYYLCAGLTILLYDHIITFSEEVEHVWEKKPSLVSYMFLLNRYYTPLSMIVIMTAFFSPSWSREACKHFVAFEPFGTAIPLLAITGTLLILRVYAIYQRNLWILLYLSALLVTQIAVGLWEFSVPGWGPTPLPQYNLDVFRGCLYAPSPNLGQLAGAYLVIEVVFDVSVFVFTMWKTWRSLWSFRRYGLVHRISHDGALYFIVIFSANCLWLFMVLFAPLGIKYLNANPAIMLIVTMINRLTLKLRVSLRAENESGLAHDDGSRKLLIGDHSNPFSRSKDVPEFVKAAARDASNERNMSAGHSVESDQ